MAVTQQVRQAVAQLNPDIPLYWVYSMDEAIARPLWYIRVFGTMFMIFGAHRALPRGDRPLRGDVVLGEPAHARSRNPHGARRAGGAGHPHDVPSGRHAARRSDDASASLLAAASAGE